MNKRVCTCVALCFGVLHVVHAQQDLPPASGLPTVTVAPVLRDRPEGLIHLDVMVTDSAGAPVSGLLASNFRLSENGREQKILSFQGFTGRGAGTEPPVKIILLIDTLEMPPELARKERNAVLFYLRKDGGRLARPTSVFLLSETGLWTTKHPFEDGTALARELELNDFALVRPNTTGERASFIARQPTQHAVAVAPGYVSGRFQYALMALGQIATEERRQPGRKLLLWLGPAGGMGPDQKTDPSLYGTICWFSALLREAHLALYSFSVGEPGPRAELYKDYLAGVASPHGASVMNLDRNVLAVESGGRVIDAAVDIEAEMAKCVGEAGPFYRISFDPFAADHTADYHGLKLEVDNPGLAARTNTGFYDEPFYSTDQIPPLKQLSLEELQRILELDESDSAKANQLKGSELTRRLSERRLANLFTIAHGKRTRHELRILADASAFLDPPDDEILGAPAPSPDEQQHIIAMASSHLTSAIHKLPNFLARRITTRYQETPMYLDARVKYQPLHQTDRSTSTVHYRHGHEDTDVEGHGLKMGNPELITYGVFDLALQNVLNAISGSKRVTWIRWEQETTGRAAVFRSTIPWDLSLRRAMMCCLPDGNGMETYQRYAGYHVEIAIEPESGAILRLAFRFDLQSTTPIMRSDIMIEYSPVQLGGKTYHCPIRSVSMVRSRSLRTLFWWDESFRSYGPYATMLNDSAFDRYHLFRSESRILTGFTPSDK